MLHHLDLIKSEAVVLAKRNYIRRFFIVKVLCTFKKILDRLAVLLYAHIARLKACNARLALKRAFFERKFVVRKPCGCGNDTKIFPVGIGLQP